MAMRYAVGVAAVVALLAPVTGAADQPRLLGREAAPARGPAVALSPCYDPDNARPVLTGLTVTPSVLRGVRRGAPSTVQVTATAVDPGGPGRASGIDRFVVFAEGERSSTVISTDLHRVGQDTYRGVFHLLGAPSGPRTLGVSLADKAGNGNQVEYTTSDLRALGFATGFTVGSRRVDQAPPRITALSVSPAVADLRHRGRTVRIRLRAVDDYTGVATVSVKIGGNLDAFAELRRTRAHPHVWAGKVRLPRGGFIALSATAPLHVFVADKAENTFEYGSPALHRAGLPDHLTVVATPDTTPPTVRLVSITPQVIDTRAGTVRARFVVRARDLGTGIRGFGVVADGVLLLENVFAAIPGTNVRLVAGTRRDGRWELTMNVTPCRVRNGLRRVLVTAFDSYQSTVLKTRAKFRALDNKRPFLKRLDAGPVTGPVTLVFTEDVTGLTEQSVQLFDGSQARNSPLHPPTPVAGSWTCTITTGTPVGCADGTFRTARFTPAAPLLPRTHYDLLINGDGQLGLTDTAGNPADGVDISSSGFFFTTDG
jgi:hypothetical protein